MQTPCLVFPLAGLVEHCYLLLAFGMVVASRRRVDVRVLFYVLLTVCLLETPLRLLLVYTGHLIFLPTHARLDSIGYGVLLAMVFHFAPEQFQRLRARRWPWVLSLVCGIIFLRGYNIPAYQFALQHDAATLVALSTLLLLYRPQTQDRRRAWPYRFVAWIGLYSYGIYLWHISVMGPCMVLFHRVPRLPTGCAVTIIWGAAIGLGFLMTKLCEVPALHLRDRLFPRRVESAVSVAPFEDLPTPLLSQ